MAGPGLIAGANLVGGVINQGHAVREQIDAMFDAAARRKAGEAFGSGDRKSAARILAARGMVDEAQKMLDTGKAEETDQLTREALQKAAGGDVSGAKAAAAQAGNVPAYSALERQEAAEMADQTKFMLDATQALRQVPPEQRAAAYEHIKPALQSIFKYRKLDPSALDQPGDLTDADLDQVAMTLGEDAQRYTIMATKGGGIVAVDRRTAKGKVIVEPEAENPLKDELLQAQIAATRSLGGQRDAAAEKARRVPAPKGGGGGGAPRSAAASMSTEELKRIAGIK